MSRSDYSDDLDEWALIRWRGAVKSALRGKRGQAFLRDILAGLDAMTEKRLIRHDLVTPEGVCALGAGCVARGIDVSAIDPEEPDDVAAALGLADAMVREIAYANDDWGDETPERRWERMRAWVASKIKESPDARWRCRAGPARGGAAADVR